MKAKYAILAVVVVLLLLGSLAALYAQEATFDINWDNQTLSAALQQLARAFNVQYNLPGELADKRVTIHRKGVTIGQAMQELAKAAGVRVITDPNGAYVFQAATTGGAGGGAIAPPVAATNPWAAGGAAVTAPAPTRPGVPGVQPQAGGFGGFGTPAAGGGAAAGGAYGATLMGANGQPINPADLVFRLLTPNRINPELVAMLFGGTAVYDISSQGGGGGGGGGGGYGSQSGNNNNSGGGMYGNSGSNSGTGNRNTGTNTGTSNRGY